MSDAYHQLVESLRDAVAQPADGGEATRQRILRDLPATKPRARTTSSLLLLAAALFVSTAFALYIAAATSRDARIAPQPPAPASSDSAVASAPAAPARGTPAWDASTDPRPAAATPPALAETSPAPVPAQRAAHDRPRSARRPSDAPPVAAPAPSAAALATSTAPSEAAPAGAGGGVAATPQQRQMLYTEAHRQHFRGSPQQALAAWDAFLATQPVGQVLLEARYNRAVTLVRLGRRKEAESALAPFASGQHASFRQVEAKQLLQRLALGAR